MKRSLNLLPFECRVRETARRRLLQWSLVWTVCAATAFGAWWLKHSRCHAFQQRLQVAQRSYAPLEKIICESDVMRGELEQLRAKGTILGKLLDERPALTLLGIVSQNARRCDGRLVVHNLSFERHERPPETDGPGPKPGRKEQPKPAIEKAEPWGSVTLTGQALDNVAVATFVVSLRESELFQSVELKSSVGNDSTDEQLRTYVLECSI